MRTTKRDVFRRALLLLLLFAVAWSYLWFPDYAKKKRMETGVVSVKEDIQLLQAKIDYNRERISLLKHDAVTIESEIRSNLRWVGPGELPVERAN